MKEELHSLPDIICDNLSQTEQRALIVHVLYALDAFDYESSLGAILDNFSRGFGITIPKESPLYAKIYDIIESRAQLDDSLIPLMANWRVDRLGVVTRIILRIALWELSNTAIDKSVVFNEAVELAKCFAEKDAYKFINGVLDEFSKRQQPAS